MASASQEGDNRCLSFGSGTEDLIEPQQGRGCYILTPTSGNDKPQGFLSPGGKGPVADSCIFMGHQPRRASRD